MIAVIVAEMALATLAGIAFLALYGLRSPWRETEMGRHLMLFMIATTAEISSLLALALGVHVPLWLFAVGFGLLDLVVLQRLWLLIKAQRRP